MSIDKNNQEKELNVIRNGRVAKDKSEMRDNEAGTDLVRRNGDTDERRKKRVDIVRATQSVRNISGNRLETDGKERSGIAVNRGKRRSGQERVKRDGVNEILETEKARRNAAFKDE